MNPGGTFDFGTLPTGASGSPGICAGRAEHSVRLRCHDQRRAGVDAHRKHARSPNSVLAPMEEISEPPTGYASLAGAHRRFDYNLFGDQFNTNGQGVNNHYSDSLVGANVGMAINDQVALRVRVRHSNSYTGRAGGMEF